MISITDFKMLYIYDEEEYGDLACVNMRYISYIYIIDKFEVIDGVGY
jgi:hypothetical protein